MSNPNVLLQILVDDKLAYEVRNPATKPTAGEFIDIPIRSFGRPGHPNHREVYVGKVVNKYPDASDSESPTIIECQCAEV